MESVETQFEEILVREAKATSTEIVAQTGAYENWEERWRNKRQPSPCETTVGCILRPALKYET
jgi:hypothetical protein